MANKAISELPQALNVNNQDLFVLEQSGIAKKLTAETFITEQGIIDALAEALDGHGGIQSVTLSSVSGRVRTYLITFTDGSATTFQVYDGTSIDRIVKTSTAGLVDTYTVFMNDGTTTFFTVTNGADGTVSEAMLNDALKDKAPAITETTESSAIATFTDGADNLVMHNIVAEINPVQSGSGDPAPDNIRPISGWTGCNVTRTGKNLAHIPVGTKTQSEVTWTCDGTSKIVTTGTASGGATFSPDISPLPQRAGTFTASFASDVSGMTYTLTKNGSWFRSISPGGSFTFSTTDSDTISGYVSCASGTNATGTSYIQIELGSTATAYEEYTAETISIDWTTEAGTVYGGTIDVATGLLTVDRKSEIADGNDIKVEGIYANGTAYSNNILDMYLDSAYQYQREARILCDKLIASPFISVSQNSYSVAHSGGRRAVFNIPTCTTVAEFNAWLADNQPQLVYYLETPQTYLLTPQQIMTLLGTNNVWTDIGNVSVTYTADTKMYIQNLTQPTEDDLVANQAITSGKYFMIGNSLYLALANIASGAQITIGTNAQRVSLADALNAINS